MGTPLSSLACQTDRRLQRATTLAPQSPTSNPATPPFPAPPCRLPTTPVLPSLPPRPAPLSLHTALCPDLLPFRHHIPTEMLVANTLHSRATSQALCSERTSHSSPGSKDGYHQTFFTDGETEAGTVRKPLRVIQQESHGARFQPQGPCP